MNQTKPKYELSLCPSVSICQSHLAVSRHNKLSSSTHSELAQSPTANVQQTYTVITMSFRFRKFSWPALCTGHTANGLPQLGHNNLSCGSAAFLAFLRMQLSRHLSPSSSCLFVCRLFFDLQICFFSNTLLKVFDVIT